MNLRLRYLLLPWGLWYSFVNQPCCQMRPPLSCPRPLKFQQNCHGCFFFVVFLRWCRWKRVAADHVTTAGVCWCLNNREQYNVQQKKNTSVWTNKLTVAVGFVHCDAFLAGYLALNASPFTLWMGVNGRWKIAKKTWKNFDRLWCSLWVRTTEPL